MAIPTDQNDLARLMDQKTFSGSTAYLKPNIISITLPFTATAYGWVNIVIGASSNQAQFVYTTGINNSGTLIDNKADTAATSGPSTTGTLVPVKPQDVVYLTSNLSGPLSAYFIPYEENII